MNVFEQSLKSIQQDPVRAQCVCVCVVCVCVCGVCVCVCVPTDRQISFSELQYLGQYRFSRGCLKSIFQTSSASSTVGASSQLRV